MTRLRRILIGTVVIVAALVTVAFFTLRQPPDVREFFSLRSEWNAAGKTSNGDAGHFAQKCLNIAERHPGTLGGISALLLAATRAPETPAGREALQHVEQQAASADLDNLVRA
jgi:hypothetical protein